MDQFIMQWYKMGLYTINDMRLAVETGNLTKEEFKEATGVDYDTPSSSAPNSQGSQTSATSSAASTTNSIAK